MRPSPKPIRERTSIPQRLSSTRSESKYIARAGLLAYFELRDSPYAEVRAAVANTDDPNMPVNTFRMWFLGLLFTILISGMNQFFNMRCAYTYIPLAYILSKVYSIL